MKIRTFHASLLGLSLLVTSCYSFADDNVCVINNSSQAITASGGEGEEDDGTYPIGANGGDQNKCWAFGTGVGEAYYEISVEWGAGGEAGDDLTVGFVNPMVGTGYFTPQPLAEDVWAANEKICQGPICVWHTDKTDVWRLYVEDAPPPTSPTNCKSLLDPDCEM